MAVVECIATVGTHRRMSGFTLIELLVVLAILAITLTMSVPVFTETRVRSEVRAAAQELAGTMRWARAEAMRTNQTALVKVGPGAQCQPGVNAAWSVEIADVVARCFSLTDFGKRYGKVQSLAVANVSFDAKGVVVAPLIGYSVAGTTTSASRNVTVELSGRVVEN